MASHKQTFHLSQGKCAISFPSTEGGKAWLTFAGPEPTTSSRGACDKKLLLRLRYHAFQVMNHLSPISPAALLMIDLLQRVAATSPFVPVACLSASVDPPHSKDTNTVISFVHHLSKQVI